MNLLLRDEFPWYLSYESNVQGGRGHWAVYYTSPQNFILTFSYSLARQLWGLGCGCFIKSRVRTFQLLIVERVICVSLLSIYRTISYPFRFLVMCLYIITNIIFLPYIHCSLMDFLKLSKIVFLNVYTYNLCATQILPATIILALEVRTLTVILLHDLCSDDKI